MSAKREFGWQLQIQGAPVFLAFLAGAFIVAALWVNEVWISWVLILGGALAITGARVIQRLVCADFAELLGGQDEEEKKPLTAEQEQFQRLLALAETLPDVNGLPRAIEIREGRYFMEIAYDVVVEGRRSRRGAWELMTPEMEGTGLYFGEVEWADEDEIS